MADITSRVSKRAAALLDEGEHVVAALLLEPRGTYGAAAIAIAALPRTSVRLLAGAAAERAVAGGGLAATLPSRSFVLALTDRRVLAIPSNGIGMSTIAAAYDPADLHLAEHASKGFGRRLRFGFVDGTGIVVDAQRGQPVERFAAGLGTRS